MGKLCNNTYAMRKTSTQLFILLIILTWCVSSVGGVNYPAGVSAEAGVVLFDVAATTTMRDTTSSEAKVNGISGGAASYTTTVGCIYDAAIGGLKIKTEYFAVVDSTVIKDVNGNTWMGMSDSKISIGGDFQPADFKVYPNPFTDFIRIGNFDKLTKIIISDITGRKVIEVENPEHVIQTDDLVSGLYFVSMYVGTDVVKASKLVKR
jgi:hypothetical protein